MLRLVSRTIASLALVAGALIIACGGGTAGGGNSIRGTVLVTQPEESWHTEEPCSTGGEFSDVHEDGRVRVTDRSGNQIGTGELKGGRGEEDDNEDTDGSETHICEFTFGVANLKTTDSYTVTLADRPSLSATYSLENIRNVFWFVTFELPQRSESTSLSDIAQ